MLGPLLTMAMILVIAGKGSVEEVDRAWMVENESSIGMFGMMDLFGLNIIFDNWNKDRLDERGKDIQPLILGFLKPYIDGNRLGIKTGEGFYHYPSPGYEGPDFLNDRPRKELFKSLLFVLIESAIALVRKDVVDAQEVDRAWTSATSLKKGPFVWLDDIGTEGFLAIHARQVEAGLSTENAASAFERFLQSRN
jgi:3-hydroxyacyl-CoA dehydrogenase